MEEQEEQFSTSRRSLPPLVSPAAAKKLRLGVIVAHAAMLILPAAIGIVIDWCTPEPPKTIRVELYDPTLTNVVENPSPNPDPSNPVVPDGDTAPAQPEPPAATPAPVPLPQVVSPPTVPQVKEQKLSARKRPKPKKKAEPIKKAEGKKSETPAKTPTAPDINRPIGAITPPNPGREGVFGAASGTGSSAPGGEKGNSAYELQVSAILKRMWVTPDQERLWGREPRVLVRLVISGNGKVLKAELLKKSGVLAMDESVSALLSQVKQLPAPPDHEQKEMSFYLKATED